MGYGLEASGPKFSFGGDTRRKADRKLVSFKGAYGLKNIAVKFSHNTGGTCFGDSGGPTFDIATPAIASQNIIVAVTSFGQNYNCNASGSSEIDQPDDLAFLADPAGDSEPPDQLIRPTPASGTAATRQWLAEPDVGVGVPVVVGHPLVSTGLVEAHRRRQGAVGVQQREPSPARDDMLLVGGPAAPPRGRCRARLAPPTSA